MQPDDPETYEVLNESEQQERVEEANTANDVYQTPLRNQTLLRIQNPNGGIRLNKFFNIPSMKTYILASLGLLNLPGTKISCGGCYIQKVDYCIITTHLYSCI